MKSEIENATSALVGNALWACRRTSDLASFQFGKKRQTRTFRGVEAEVGEYALNVQCAWRVAREDRVVAGSADLYYPSDLQIQQTPPNFDWNQEPNRLDELLRLLFEDGKRQFLVQRVGVGHAGSLHIVMEEDLSLDVLPNDSLGEEYWRLFKQSGDGTHFVVTGHGVQS